MYHNGQIGNGQIIDRQIIGGARIFQMRFELNNLLRRIFS